MTNLFYHSSGYRSELDLDGLMDPVDAQASHIGLLALGSAGDAFDLGNFYFCPSVDLLNR